MIYYASFFSKIFIIIPLLIVFDAICVFLVLSMSAVYILQ